MRTSSLILILSASGSACSSASRIAVLVLLLVCTEPRVRLLVSIPAIELLLDERLAPRGFSGAALSPGPTLRHSHPT